MASDKKVPVWAKEFLDKYNAGITHVFLLHQNVQDYVGSSTNLRTYLAKLFIDLRTKIVVFYNRAEGLTFPMESMKDDFVRVLGLDKQQDEVLAALQGATGDNVTLPKTPGQALTLLDTLLHAKDGEDNSIPCTVIIEHAETIIPNGDYATMSPEDRTAVVQIQRWATDSQLSMAANPVILITRNLTDVHQDLRAAGSKVEAIKIPLPDYNERLKYITHILSSPPEGEEPTRLDGLITEEFTTMTAGLSKVNIEDIDLRARCDGKEEKLEKIITLELIRERKKDIVRSEYADVIETMEPTFGFEAIGGLRHVKKYMQEDIVQPIREGRKNEVPMGVAFFGPPGTGKTAVMLAAAKESGFNCLALNIGKILGSFVGSSERNLEKALSCIDALTPCFVFIDEIDQAGIGRGSGGDSGVGNRLFKRLLEYVSDSNHRGKVVFFFASNRPDLIDAALKRPGRMDAKIPFTVPNAEDRIETFLALGRRDGVRYENVEWEDVKKKTNGWTGAEIESAITKARRTARKSGRDVVIGDDIHHALWAISPSTGEIEFQTLLAVKECNDKDLLPPEYQEKLSDRTALEKDINRLIPDEGRRRARRGRAQSE